jgi:DNA-binding NarL/FixJ family response regulator
MGRTLSGIVPAKEQQQTAAPSAAHREDGPLVCVAMENVLAARYVLHVLSRDRSLRVVLFDDLTKSTLNRPASVFILDCSNLNLPLGECLRILNAKYTGARYIALDRGKSFEEIMEALGLGIHGFIPYEQVNYSLIPAIHSVCQGKLWISNRVLQEYVQRSQYSMLHSVRKALRSQQLTKRENQIMELAKRRLSNKEIAALLNIRESTVKFHLSNIFSKLQITCRNDLLDTRPGEELWRKLLAS